MSPQEGPVVYDKGKYHGDAVEKYGLPESHAYHHTLYFFRWLIEHDLMSDFFWSETESFEPGGVTNQAVLQTYEWWDCCLADDMLSDEGNAFSQYYFDFDKGRYLSDYMGLLQGDLPSEYHIPLTEESYQRLKTVIDRRYDEWKAQTKNPSDKSTRPSPTQGGPGRAKRWWEFWRK
ncbi:MAG: DUF7832 domain-containing protein [Planctomycetota bacterium]|jgi:hypothetical protein